MNYNVGNIIDEYKLVSECGRGAYGTVFIAENMNSRRRVALKIVYNHGRNFERELKGLHQYQAISQNTNLLQIYKVREYSEFFYYTMDAADNLAAENNCYLPDTLGNRLKLRRLDADEVSRMTDELLDNLAVLHKKGVFHRDIKPDNILFIDNRALLGDIGLITDSENTILAGTPGFMPSEVLAGLRNYSARDDYYALGKVIYCALTRQPVNQYPSFPESCTLTGAGKLIKLYNQFCSEENPVTAASSRPHKRFIWWAAAAAVAGAGLTVLINTVMTSGSWGGFDSEDPLDGVSGEITSIQRQKIIRELTLQENQLNFRRENCYRILQDLLQEYTPQAELLQIYPELLEQHRRNISAPKHSSATETADEKLLAEYFSLENALPELFEKIKHSIADYAEFPLEDQKVLTQMQNRRRQLEEILVKKYTAGP